MATARLLQVRQAARFRWSREIFRELRRRRLAQGRRAFGGITCTELRELLINRGGAAAVIYSRLTIQLPYKVTPAGSRSH